MQLGCSYNKTENKITNQSEDRNRVFVQISTVYPLHY